jgi:hypothetical protein
MIGPTDLLHPTPTPQFKTYQVFLIYCPKRPSFSTTQSHAYRNIISDILKKYAVGSDLHPGNSLTHLGEIGHVPVLNSVGGETRIYPYLSRAAATAQEGQLPLFKRHYMT